MTVNSVPSGQCPLWNIWYLNTNRASGLHLKLKGFLHLARIWWQCATCQVLCWALRAQHRHHLCCHADSWQDTSLNSFWNHHCHKHQKENILNRDSSEILGLSDLANKNVGCPYPTQKASLLSSIGWGQEEGGYFRKREVHIERYPAREAAAWV